MTQLLVSVRSASEAESALVGGADLIDVKEPSRGPLGRADDALIEQVVEAVAGRRPVSVALGELLDQPLVPRFDGLVKVGLAGCGSRSSWGDLLGDFVTMHALPASQLVAVAYADHQRAGSPSPAEVLGFALTIGCPVLLLDTWGKDGSTLLDWRPLDTLQELRAACREAHLRLALAGSLTEREIEKLLPMAPDVIAVRRAACSRGHRDGEVDRHAVRRLADLVHGSCRKLTARTEETFSAARAK